VNTQSDFRDNHLRSPEMLGADEFPQITFTSTGIERTGDAGFTMTGDTMTGDLTIRGTTQPVEIGWTFAGIAKDPMGNVRTGFEGTAEINRKDFGITFNAPLETGGVLVSDKVVLEFDVSAIKGATE
jgi:polyisoprenoid-binding protein YceI